MLINFYFLIKYAVKYPALTNEAIRLPLSAASADKQRVAVKFVLCIKQLHKSVN